jgi:hypothetical protein
LSFCKFEKLLDVNFLSMAGGFLFCKTAASLLDFTKERPKFGE